MDYKALLEKYIQHVGACEGVDFISDINESGRMDWRGSDVTFTPEEAKELQDLSGYRPWPARTE